MTVRGGRGWWLAGVAVGLVVCVLGFLLRRAGLADADRWASVISVFLNLAGLAVAGYSAVQARRVPTARAVADGQVDNRIGRGDFTGPVLMGRDLERVDAAGGPVPDPAVGQPQPDASQPGGVANTIEGGRFGGPVVMGRDMRGIVLPPPAGQRPDVNGPADR
ncbi:hypothetical protein [Micromonospora echinofusca]|uniref:Uncharacterized protein n=1 Tax=Micromonospora echinofusca TaxID=47858 RepID=A0ABS3VR85_MICEH|nr:hypothetical protein [Micromonospora echinofusca]MBO4207030.1 hypothetical protein [Micromonospora echinofusca]